MKKEIFYCDICKCELLEFIDSKEKIHVYWSDPHMPWHGDRYIYNDKDVNDIKENFILKIKSFFNKKINVKTEKYYGFSEGYKFSILNDICHNCNEGLKAAVINFVNARIKDL